MACLVCDVPLDKDPVRGRSIAIQNYSFFRLHHFIAGLGAGHRNTFASRAERTLSV
jgi:hypothetical protein